MKQYLDYLNDILTNGQKTEADRTGAGTIGVFQRQARFDLNDGFPITTTKSTYFKGVAQELFWFLSGSDNIKPLLEKKVRIWTLDAMRKNIDYILESGLFTEADLKEAQSKASRSRQALMDGNVLTANELMSEAQNLQRMYEGAILRDDEFALKAGAVGPSYGPQWRGQNGAEAADQISNLETALREGGTSRRMIVSAWNSKQVPEMALPACHCLYQVHVAPETQDLTLGWYQRSCDSILGVPFNIASYALLAELLAHTHGFGKGEVVGTFADAHIYLPHLAAAREQVAREPKDLPQLLIKNKHDSVLDYTMDDIELVGYEPHPPLENPTPMYGGLF